MMAKEKRIFSSSHTVLELWPVEIFTTSTRWRFIMRALLFCSWSNANLRVSSWVLCMDAQKLVSACFEGQGIQICSQNSRKTTFSWR